MRHYKPGQIISLTVDIVSNHMGYFQFRLCPHNNHRYPVQQTCLDKYLLKLVDGSDKYFIEEGTGLFTVQVRLNYDYH